MHKARSHTFSKNRGTTSKFWSPEGRN